MAVTVTWSDGVNPPTVYRISDEVLASLDRYRTERDLVLDANGIVQPRWGSLEEMVIGGTDQAVVQPALEVYPTPALQALKAERDAAAERYTAARMSAIEVVE